MNTSFKLTLLVASAFSAAVACSSIDDGAIDSYEPGYYDDTDKPASGDKFDEIADNPFVKTTDENVSTFSVDADGAAYAYMRRCVGGKLLPSKNAVRIEEFLNYFTFAYPSPEQESDIALNAEVGPCPWNSAHRLLRLGMKGREASENAQPKSNYVFLVDVSGSMYSEDKLPLLKNCLSTLVDYLNPDDRISIVTYSGEVKKVLESTSAKNASEIKKAISKLSAGGSTAGGQGMRMAYEECLQNYIDGGNNRVIMGTDGDFNVGETSTDAVLELAESYANKDIYLTVCGFGSGNLNDSMMETVSNKGNGTYEYIDSELQMEKVFVAETGKFVSVANDCKTQVTFNAEAVDSYRLIGYENRVLKNEDFDNDDVDAAEIGSGQTITALYEIVPAAGYSAGANICTFDFRYKKSLGADSVPLSVKVTAEEDGTAISENLSFAAGIAAFGMLLRDSEYKGDSTFDMAYTLAETGSKTEVTPFQTRLREQFLALIRQAQGLER